MNIILLISAILLSSLSFSYNVYAMSPVVCERKEFSIEDFKKFDFIAKGKVTKKSSIFNFLNDKAEIPFYVDVEKAWKGAKAGERVTIIHHLKYQQFPYKVGDTSIVYATKNGANFQTGECTLYKFPMSEEMRSFVESDRPSPSMLKNASPKEQRYHEEMDKKLQKLAEDALDTMVGQQ